MQISAPVQPGNSGGPVLDRSGNVVGVVVSKLDAIRAAAITGDIAQNVNFAIHSSIVTSFLDSYSVGYSIEPFERQKPISDIVSEAIPAVVVLECVGERNIETTAASAVRPKVTGQEPRQSAMLCGRPVEYAVNPTGINTGFLGVWTGNWNNASRLCGGLIVEKIASNGAAEVIYVYGPSRPGSQLAWKQQHRAGFLSGGKLTFDDDQGSMFNFFHAGLDMLGATFASRSGQLSGSFEKSR
jgi:hypothetical protein